MVVDGTQILMKRIKPHQSFDGKFTLIVYVYRNDNEIKNTIGFKQLGNKWWEATKLSHEEMKTSLLLQLRLQAIVPPPFFSIKINLCEKDNEQVKIDFETLSSGEIGRASCRERV